MAIKLRKCLLSMKTFKVTLLAALTLSVTLVFGQETKSISIGDLSYSTDEAASADRINWPNEAPYLDESGMLHTYGWYVGVNRSWQDAGGVDWSRQIAMMVENKSADYQVIGVPQTFTRVFRSKFPSRTVDGTVWTSTVDLDEQTESSLPADAMFHHQWKLWPDYGMDLTLDRWTYLFAADQYDDFVVMEYELTNTGSQPRNGVYFAVAGAMNSDAYYPGDLWGDLYGARYNDGTDSLRFWYGWDADQTVSPDIDDRARPDAVWGYFNEPQVMGEVVLHADKSSTDHSDDPNQPFKAGWSYRELAPDLNVSNHEEIYNNYLAGGWYGTMVGQDYSRVLDPAGNQVNFGDPDALFRTLDPSVFVNGKFPEHTFDPNNEQNKQSLFDFGPYDLQPGQHVRVVLAIVGGMIPRKLAIDAGRAYVNGNPGQRQEQAISYNVYNNADNPLVDNGQLIASAGSMLTQDQKDAILDISKERAFREAGFVNRLWQNANVSEGTGTFNIPLAPASPSITVTSQNSQIQLQWGDEAENDAGKAGPVVAYNIYRNYWRPPSVTQPTDTAWVRVAQVAPDQREYLDTDVIVGEQYRYYITAACVDPATGDTLESSAFQNRMHSNDGKEPAQPTRNFDTNWQKDVVVVPNPFHIQAADKYSGLHLQFMNLPQYCKIHIYTMAGDRVRTLIHNSGDGDELWLNQLTYTEMQVVSGVYLFVVQETDANMNPTGKTTTGKFVVIK